ncbi:MAG: sigma 54-interacting transcriptional regulator [Deltaproteobacteria bacterium]|nr:sigma 54-interacting transcriptional regulator [Deltaproteobacteria bacterium]MBN2674563.1 sigma 54-interacting transcriptional regulator [Deltaproteobacteria bacterium]
MTTENNFSSEIIGNSPALLSVLKKAKQVAPTDCTVLIAGETGTGKELLARGLHMNSTRKDMPFVAVNCAALSKDLLESELFGHVQGAFTSAMRNREGRFQIADGGTIFLDEIGELPLDLQGKLLRVLQFKEFSAVGESRVRHVDVRIIAATNANLLQAANEGTFRQDLYYRLNVIQLKLPSLKERPGDIKSLCDHFITKASKRYNKPYTQLSESALSRVISHNWPGNIRELENAMEHAVLIGMSEQIETDDLPFFDQTDADTMVDFIRPLTDEGLNLANTLRNIEAHYIQAALDYTDGNKNQAANLLGLNRTTLVEKIKRGLPESLSNVG